MAICTYSFNGDLLATGMPAIKQFLFEGGLERFLPNENAPKLAGQVDNKADTELESLVKQYASESGAPTRAEMAEALRQYREVEAKYFNADGSQKARAMLAPNGMATNLNQRQWIMTRTDNFKKWFGDWENIPESASKAVDENGEPKAKGRVDNVLIEPFAYTSMPETFKRDIAKWEHVSKSPYSDSYYNKQGKTWDSTPEGIIRIADHWNFQSQGKLHMKTNIPISNNDYWAKAQYKNGIWEVLEVLPASRKDYNRMIEQQNQLNKIDKEEGIKINELGFARKNTKTGMVQGKIIKKNNKSIVVESDDGIIYKWSDFFVSDISDKYAVKVFVNSVTGDIKLATANTGSFGTNSNDIRFSRTFEDDKAELESILSDGKLPAKKWFNTDALITNMVDSSHPLRVWARSLPDQVTAGRMLNDFDRATNIKQVIEKRAGIKFKRSISGAINKFAKDNGVKFNVAMDAIGNWASMRYALESGQSFKEYSTADLTRLKSELETKFGKANLEQAIQPTLDMNQWRLEHLDDKHGKLLGKALTDLQTPNYVPLLSEHGISDSYTEFEESAKFVGFEDFRDSLKSIYKAIAADIKTANPSLSDTEINSQVKDEHGLSSKKGVVSITDPKAQEAMNDLSSESIPSILKPIAAFTRFQAQMVTAMLPGFAPTNMIRDVWERGENLRTRIVPGYEDKNMNDIANQGILISALNLKNIKQLMGVLAEGTTLESKFSPDNNSQTVQEFREYLRLGASSTYGDYLASNKEGLAKELQKIGGIHEKVFDPLMLWNNAFEMISGFSMYQAMKNAGIDEKNAAATSLNLMNFGKRGKIMNPLRSLFMFASPIAMGGYQLAKTLNTRRGQLRLAAYTAVAMVLYSLLRSIDGDDDDELGYNRMDEQSNFALYRGIPIPLGNGEYFYIPIGFGLAQLGWANGVNFVRTSLGNMTMSEMLGESALLAIRSAAPVAPAEGSMMKNPAVYIAQTFTPQIARPIMNIAMDVNAFMSPLTNSRYEKTDTAKALQGRPNTPKEYKEMAQMLGKAGIDMYPEQLRELMRGYGAGLFNEVIKYAIENPAKEDRGLKTVSPLIDRWYKASNDDQIKQKLYYNARNKMNEASIIKHNGGELTEEEAQLAKLGDTLKKKEASTRSKYAAATKAEKSGHEQRAENIRKAADRMRNNYMDFAFDEIKKIEGD